MKRVLLSSTALAIALSPAYSALADTAGKGEAAGATQTMMLDEVVVSAQKRVENVQDVPIAVTAFTGASLAARNINSVQGLSNLTPNVTLDAGSPFSGSSFVLTAYVRGIGQDDFAFNLDPGVGIYLDGVYLARTVGANLDLLDVERIEVLRGPQGTLFGRNSIGGAISIVTRDPATEFGGRAEIITGRYDRFDVQGTIDIPIAGDKLLSNISFASANRDGYVKRMPYPATGYVMDGPAAYPRAGYRTTDLEGGEDRWSLRGKLLWNASERLRVTLTGDYQKIDQPAMANTLLAAFPLQNVPGELFGTAYNLCISVPNNLLPSDIGGNIQAMCGIRGTIGTSFGNANVDADPNNDRLPFDDRYITNDIDTTYATGPHYSILENWGLSAIVDFEINDNMTLKSITGYRELHWDTAMDVDASPLTIVEPGFWTNQKQFSEELQLTGTAFGGDLTYVFGAYYFKETGNLWDFVPFAEGLLQVDGNNTFDTRAFAGFAHLNYAVSNRFSITLGGRYTDERKLYEGFQRDPNGFLYKLVFGRQLADITEADRLALGFPDPNDPLRFYPPGVNRKEFTNFSPRIGVEFKPTDEMMLYASFSKGYKTGGWTTRLSSPEASAPDFDEELADSYEVGLKSELFDRRLRFNLAGFYTEYDGIQLTQTNGISPTTRNAGNAELYGFEAEFQAAITEAFQLTGGIGYIHDKYTMKLPGTTAGDRLPKTPHWKFNLSPRYTVDLGNQGRVIVNADYTHTSSLYNNTENTELLKREPVDMLNASLTYEDPSERWTLAVGATNLINERYLTTGQFQVGGSIIYGTYSRPTEWYAKVGVNF